MTAGARLIRIVAVPLDERVGRRSILDFGTCMQDAQTLCLDYRARGYVAYLPDDLDF